MYDFLFFNRVSCGYRGPVENSRREARKLRGSGWRRAGCSAALILSRPPTPFSVPRYRHRVATACDAKSLRVFTRFSPPGGRSCRNLFTCKTRTHSAVLPPDFLDTGESPSTRDSTIRSRACEQRMHTDIHGFLYLRTRSTSSHSLAERRSADAW